MTSGDANHPNGIAYHNGALVGTTFYGGEYQCGTVFALSPDRTGHWSETVLHSFLYDHVDGCDPVGGVAFDEEGDIYGMTASGGSGFFGTVFELSRNASGDWDESILHNFTGPTGHPRGMAPRRYSTGQATCMERPDLVVLAVMAQSSS